MTAKTIWGRPCVEFHSYDSSCSTLDSLPFSWIEEWQLVLSGLGSQKFCGSQLLAMIRDCC